MYRWVYAREPDPEEVQVALAHITRHESSPQVAYEDLLWALLNTREFLFNNYALTDRCRLTASPTGCAGRPSCVQPTAHAVGVPFNRKPNGLRRQDAAGCEPLDGARTPLALRLNACPTGCGAGCARRWRDV